MPENAFTCYFLENVKIKKTHAVRDTFAATDCNGSSRCL